MLKALQGVFTSQRTNSNLILGISSIQTSTTSLFFTQCLCSSFSVNIFQMPKQTRYVFWVSDIPLSGWSRTVPDACCSVPSAHLLAEAICSCLSILPFQSTNAIFCSESAWRRLLSDRKKPQNMKIKCLWFCYIFATNNHLLQNDSFHSLVLIGKGLLVK